MSRDGLFHGARCEDFRAKGFMQGIATGVALRGSGYLERVVIKEYILS